MEARKITVVSTKTQKKSVIMSGAETLGQLKQDLSTAGIDYQDMAFFEGTSRTELIADDSVLPHDVPYTNRTTGETKNTNELVFMLTNSNKKIKSGALRKELYDKIKEHKLQDACISRYGKNFTQVSSENLINLINASEQINQMSTPSTPNKPEPYYALDTPESLAINRLIQIMVEKNLLSEEEMKHILVYFKENSSPYSDEEIDDMFNGMCD